MTTLLLQSQPLLHRHKFWFIVSWTDRCITSTKQERPPTLESSYLKTSTSNTEILVELSNRKTRILVEWVESTPQLATIVSQALLANTQYSITDSILITHYVCAANKNQYNQAVHTDQDTFQKHWALMLHPQQLRTFCKQQFIHHPPRSIRYTPSTFQTFEIRKSMLVTKNMPFLMYYLPNYTPLWWGYHTSWIVSNEIKQ